MGKPGGNPGAEAWHLAPGISDNSPFFSFPLLPELAVEGRAWCDLLLDDRPVWPVGGPTCSHCFFRNRNPERDQEDFLKSMRKFLKSANEFLIIYFSYPFGIYLAFLMLNSKRHFVTIQGGVVCPRQNMPVIKGQSGRRESPFCYSLLARGKMAD